eukprot:g14203.t1
MVAADAGSLFLPSPQHSSSPAVPATRDADFVSDFWRSSRRSKREVDAQIEAEELPSAFVAEETPNALADALEFAGKQQKAFLRFACDGTTRETRVGGKVDFGGSWFITQVSAWLGDSGEVEGEGANVWPKWDDLPCHTHLTPPEERTAQKGSLSADERKAVLVAEKVAHFLKAFPPDTDVCAILCGDGAEELTNRDALILVMSYVKQHLPRLRFFPYYHLCDQHSTANASSDALNVFCCLAGVDRARFQKKFYLHGLQMKRDVMRITHNVGVQMESCIWPVENWDADGVTSERFQVFLDDMHRKQSADAWTGCYPHADSNADGKRDFAFIVPRSTGERKDGVKNIKTEWDRAYRCIKPPQEHRWFTSGDFGRRVSVCNSLGYMEMAFPQLQPWFFGDADWLAVNDGAQKLGLFNGVPCMVGYMQAPLDTMSRNLLRKPKSRLYASAAFLHEQSEHAFEDTLVKLYDVNRMKSSFDFVAAFSADLADHQRNRLRIAATHALHASHVNFWRRVSSSVADSCEQFLARFRRVSGEAQNGLHAEPRAVEQMTEEWANPSEESLKRRPALVNNNEAICVEQWKRLLRPLKDADRVRAVKWLSKGILASARHQADCERKVARVKSRQQENKNAHRSIARINMLEIKQTVSTGWKKAQDYADLGTDDSEEEQDRFWLSNPGDDGEEELFYTNSELDNMAHGVSWYTLQQKRKKVFGNEVPELTDQEKKELRAKAIEINQRKRENEERREKEADSRRMRKQEGWVERQERAVPQLKFFEALALRVKSRFECQIGSGGSGLKKHMAAAPTVAVCDGDTEKPAPRVSPLLHGVLPKIFYAKHRKLEELKHQLETKDPDLGERWKMLTEQMQLYKVVSCGVEKLAAWIGGCTTAKDSEMTWGKMAALLREDIDEDDLDGERLGEEVSLRLEMGQLFEEKLPDVEDYFRQNPSSLIGIMLDRKYLPQPAEPSGDVFAGLLDLEQRRTTDRLTDQEKEVRDFPECVALCHICRKPHRFAGLRGTVVMEEHDDLLGDAEMEMKALIEKTTVDKKNFFTSDQSQSGAASFV